MGGDKKNPADEARARIGGKVIKFEKRRAKQERSQSTENDFPSNSAGVRRKRSNNPDEWTENQIQRRVAAVLDKLGLCWHHTPNEGRRNKIAGRHLKLSGMKSGVPDILIYNTVYEGDTAYKGLAIELKRKKGGRLTANQKMWLDDLKRNGFRVAVCHGYEDTLKLLSDLGLLKKKES